MPEVEVGSRSLPKPAGVLFDFGDTILHEGPFDVLAGVKAVLAVASGPPTQTAEELAEALSDLLADLDPRRRTSQLELPPHLTMKLIYEPHGIEFDLSAEELEWTFWRAATTWTPEPGIQEVLTALSDLNVPCGVVSNTAFTGETLSRQLATSGLDGPISWVMASADYVVRKPHHLLFDLALRRLGTRPEVTWFVGDSFECDIEGAAAAGLVPIWYDTARAGTDRGAPAVRAVASWQEFLHLLATSTA